ncbi:MAG: SDR family NAD(P)-dependent oxidoreductase, partial [Pseudomonadota bacterium]
MRLERKTAIVTGGGSGFGAGIARKFVAEGAQVFVVDINLKGAEAIAAEIGGTAIACDVSDKTSVAHLAQTVLSQGPLDILVNNAGVTHLPGQLEDITEEDFD